MASDEAFERFHTDVLRQGTDIGHHAGIEATKSVIRVIEALPTDAHRAVAMGVALGFIQNKIDGLLDMGDGPFDHILKLAFKVTHATLSAAPETKQVMDLLRAGDLKGAAAIIGMDPADFEDGNP